MKLLFAGSLAACCYVLFRKRGQEVVAGCGHKYIVRNRYDLVMSRFGRPQLCQICLARDFLDREINK